MGPSTSDERTTVRCAYREVAGLTQICAQPLYQHLRYIIEIALELFAAVFSELGDRRLRGVPEARAILSSDRNSDLPY